MGTTIARAQIQRTGKYTEKILWYIYSLGIDAEQTLNESDNMTGKKKVAGLDDDYRSILLDSGVTMR
ncbi:MAG: hypothetical protein RPR97_12515 [Colwellia sp.]